MHVKGTPLNLLPESVRLIRELIGRINVNNEAELVHTALLLLEQVINQKSAGKFVGVFDGNKNLLELLVPTLLRKM